MLRSADYDAYLDWLDNLPGDNEMADALAPRRSQRPRALLRMARLLRRWLDAAIESIERVARPGALARQHKGI